MAILSDAFMTIVNVTRELDGRIWDYQTQTWLPPTPDSEVAAEQAISETVGAVLDLIPFPFSINVMGLFTINVDRTKMDSTVNRIQDAVKGYVSATRNLPIQDDTV